MPFVKRSAVDRESGQAMLEFAGVLLVVTVIIAGVAALGLPGTVLAGVSRSVQNVLSGTSGHGSGAGGSSGAGGAGGQAGAGGAAGGVAGGAVGGSGAAGGSGAGANPLESQVQAAAANAKRLVDAGGDGWGNPSTLARHFADHGGDFGSPSAEAYAQEAQQFLQRAIAERLPMKVGPDGTIRVYDPGTNTFGSYNPDGTTKTYFKPSSGEQYWQRQPGEDPWAEPGSGGGDTSGGSGGDSGGSNSGGSGGDVPAPEPPGLPDIPDIPDIPIVP